MGGCVVSDSENNSAVLTKLTLNFHPLRGVEVHPVVRPPSLLVLVVCTAWMCMCGDLESGGYLWTSIQCYTLSPVMEDI